MSGRSFLCDLWFSQTLRHKNYIYIYIYIFELLRFILLTWSEEVLSTETAVTTTE